MSHSVARFAEPALRLRVVNGDAIDDHVNFQFAFDARAEDARLNPLDEFAGALAWTVLVVNLRDVDGIDAAAQLLQVRALTIPAPQACAAAGGTTSKSVIGTPGCSNDS